MEKLLHAQFPKASEDIMEIAEGAKKTLFERTGAGSKMTEWIDWPQTFIESVEYEYMKKIAGIIRKRDTAVVVIGIGGSYLGTRAVLESEYGQYYNELAKGEGPLIYFTGNELSPDGLQAIGELLEYEDFSIVYVSKSGGTIEPALAFRYFYGMLKEKYGSEEYADDRVIAITGKEGILHDLAEKHSWRMFSIPEGIGGRYSVLTPVGLFPLAILGIDTDELLKGAIEAMKPEGVQQAEAYAMYRMSQYWHGMCNVECLAVNSQRLQYFGEWFKQLFAESEGKDESGIYPTSAIFPTDLHSIGQYLQEGTRDLMFETQVIREFNRTISIPEGDSEDGLDKYMSKSFNNAADAAMEGAAAAHEDGGMAIAKIYVGSSIQAFGYLLQFMMTACGISAYMLGVNPFDQPGVEQHKREMKKRLSEM